MILESLSNLTVTKKLVLSSLHIALSNECSYNVEPVTKLPEVTVTLLSPPHSVEE